MSSTSTTHAGTDVGQPDDGGPATGTRFRFGARPTIGTSAALKAVAQDTSELVRAEIELAKAEVAEGVKANAAAVGLLVGAGVMLWLATQGLLIAAGLALALVVPGWASALIISAALIVLAGIGALIARRLLGTPIRVDQTKTNVQEDVAWFKTHLPRR